MRFILKIIAFPFFLILAPVVALGQFLAHISTALLWVVSGLFTLAGIVTFVWSVEVYSLSDFEFRMGVMQLAVAFIFSPYCLPKLLHLFMDWLERRKDGLWIFLAS